MKTLKLTLLIILLAGSAAAQISSSTSAAPDVTVLKIRWRRVERSNPQLNQPSQSGNPEDALKMAVNTARINEYNSARDSGANPRPPALLSTPSTTYSPAPPPVRMWAGFIYEFTVKNTGSKTVRKLVWEYSFTDPATQRTVGRRQYKSNVKILPGMTAKLVVRSTLPPVGTINAAQAGGRNSQDQSPEQMVIQSIKYADGSVWQRSSK